MKFRVHSRQRATGLVGSSLIGLVTVLSLGLMSTAPASAAGGGTWPSVPVCKTC